jgi:hypothetical protein
MDDEIKYVYIYALIDPRDGKIRYIGKTNSLKRRYLAHINPSNLKPLNHKSNWIKVLLSLNLRPEIIEIEKVPFNIWQEKEREWIAFYREEGCDLTNGTDGGEGAEGAKRTELQILKMIEGKRRLNKQQKNILNRKFELIENIGITKKELDVIDNIFDIKERNFLYSMLIFSKSKVFSYKELIGDPIVSFIDYQFLKNVIRCSQIKLTLINAEKIINSFEKLGFIRHTSNGIEVLINNDDSPVRFTIKPFFKFEDIVDEYLRYFDHKNNKTINCKLCGCEMIKTTNNRKYCIYCRAIRNKEIGRENSRKSRNSKRTNARIKSITFNYIEEYQYTKSKENYARKHKNVKIKIRIRRK